MFVSSSRKNKNCFEKGDVKKMPLVAFGDGLKNKDHLKFKGHRHGLSNKIYKQLKLREGLGELLLLDINECNTSKVSHDSTFSYIVDFKAFYYRLATRV